MAEGEAEEPAVGTPEQAVRAALGRAKARAAARGLGRRRRPRQRPGQEPAQDSASRDPVLVGDVLDSLVATKGWGEDLSVNAVLARWTEVVGDQVAEHCQPERFEDGVLTVRADSTAWAQQVRLLSAALLGRLATEVGDGVVTRVTVLGPVGPSWRNGPRVAPGRGPRDTYG